MNYSDGLVTILNGDAWELATTLEPQSIHTVITSPPYWAMREYGTGTWLGGDEQCDHRVPRANKVYNNPSMNRPCRELTLTKGYRDICGKCGAKRVDTQLGLEENPQEYIDRIVNLFKLLRPAMRDDSTVWLNLGDSYSSSSYIIEDCNIKRKDMLAIPWRVALALQKDGWYLRQDIIWSKNNPVPESVRDRPTKSHEYIFLLAKNERYYYDLESIKELAVKPNEGDANGRKNKRSVWTTSVAKFPHAHFAVFPTELIRPCVLAGCPEGGVVLDPFIGSGTTAQVARSLGRKCLGFELNAGFIELAARHRLNQDLLM